MPTQNRNPPTPCQNISDTGTCQPCLTNIASQMSCPLALIRQSCRLRHLIIAFDCSSQASELIKDAVVAHLHPEGQLQAVGLAKLQHIAWLETAWLVGLQPAVIVPCAMLAAKICHKAVLSRFVHHGMPLCYLHAQAGCKLEAESYAVCCYCIDEQPLLVEPMHASRNRSTTEKRKMHSRNEDELTASTIEILPCCSSMHGCSNM